MGRVCSEYSPVISEWRRLDQSRDSGTIIININIQNNKPGVNKGHHSPPQTLMKQSGPIMSETRKQNKNNKIKHDKFLLMEQSVLLAAGGRGGHWATGPLGRVTS